MNTWEEVIKYVIPEVLLNNFEVLRIKGDVQEIRIYLDEKSVAPRLEGERRGKAIYSKGYSKPVEIQDFPIRGKKCVYVVRRKKWKVVGENGIVVRSIKLSKEQTNLTKEFADFLKG